MNSAKPFEIPKDLIWKAYLEVKRNKGGPGIDSESVADFERDLKHNLYRIWNRMSSGTYFPPPVRGVPIPKKSGGVRLLGVPTVADRIAQTAVKMKLEPLLEPIFDRDSYGYRPGRSAHDALRVTRQRCWRYDWVVEFDIVGLFDHIDHTLLMKALRLKCQCGWVLLYVERWLTAPLQHQDGRLEQRTRGTPQGGVVSPLLSNLFMHYAFDAWMRRTMPQTPFCRYADDGLLHCRSKHEAELKLARLGQRFAEVGLKIHPEKSGVVYCKDTNRKGEHEVIRFEFLGYDFRPRRCVDRNGRVHPNFLPAVGRKALKAMHREMRSWHLQLRTDKTIEDLSRTLNPILRGWMQYYGKFYPSALSRLWRGFHYYLFRWVRRKHRRLANGKRRAREYLDRLARSRPSLFVPWQSGCFPGG